MSDGSDEASGALAGGPCGGPQYPQELGRREGAAARGGGLALSLPVGPHVPFCFDAISSRPSRLVTFVLWPHRAELSFLKFRFLFRGQEPCVYTRGRAKERARQGLARRFPPAGGLSTPGPSTTSRPGHRPWPLSRSEVKREPARAQKPAPRQPRS